MNKTIKEKLRKEMEIMDPGDNGEGFEKLELIKNIFLKLVENNFGSNLQVSQSVLLVKSFLKLDLKI